MISGNFISVDVPSNIVVGEDIEVTIDFYAINPGALYWKTFLIADSFRLNLLKELDATRETGQEGGRKKTYNLGKMPDKDVTITFLIFAHDDAGYDWDWDEYAVWLDSHPVEVTHLDSAYRFISPIGVPPEEQHFVGEITNVIKAPESTASDVILLVSWVASADWVNYLGWETRVTVSGIGVQSDSQNHVGLDGSRTDQPFEMGAWSPGTYNVTIKLEAKGILGQWVILDQITRTVIVKGVEPPPNGEEPPDEKKFPWAPVAIGAGAVIAIAGLASAARRK